MIRLLYGILTMGLRIMAWSSMFFISVFKSTLYQSENSLIMDLGNFYPLIYLVFYMMVVPVGCIATGTELIIV